MNTTDKLARIKEICQTNLELASKRTPGEWDALQSRVLCDGWTLASMNQNNQWSNASFIAACAGSAEAGWKATLAAIDALQKIACFHEGETVSGAFDEPASAAEAREAILSIISAWEDQL